jgi:two-component system cell cycle response regulator
MTIRILNVDDSRTVRLVVTKTFQRYDCTVCEACNGEEGLAAAGREKPDLIILDVIMPVMDGIAMLARLRADPELKTIPVIMLTAESDRETVRQIAKLGVSDYLMKPFKENQLLERVGRLITLRKKELVAQQYHLSPISEESVGLIG